MAFDLTGAEVVSEKTLGGLGPVGIVRRAPDVPAEDWQGFDVIALRRLEKDENESEEALADLQRDAEALVGFEHPNVLRVFGVLEHKGEKYVAMEWIQAYDAVTMLARREIALNRAVPIARLVASGLTAMIGAGVLHRDFRTSAIMIGSEQIRIVPLACPMDYRVEHRASVSGLFRGSAQYAAPEIHATGGAKRDEASLVFAFGVVLFELMTGQTPWRGGTPTRMLVDIQDTEARTAESIVPEAPKEVSRICMRCLDKDPQRRYPNVAAIEASLRIATETAAIKYRKQTGAMPTAAKRPSAPLPVVRQRMSSRQVGVVVTLLLIVAAAVGLGVMSSLGEKEPPATVEQAGNELLMQADARIRAGRHEEAMRLLDAHRAQRSMDPTRFDSLYNDARLRHWSGVAKRAEEADDWAEAGKALDRLLTLTPEDKRAELQVRRDSVTFRACRGRIEHSEEEGDWAALVAAAEEAIALGERLGLSTEQVEKQKRVLEFGRAMLEAAKARDAGNGEREMASLFAAAGVRRSHRAVVSRLTELDAGPFVARDVIGRALLELRQGRRDDALELAVKAKKLWPFDTRAAAIEEFVTDARTCESHGMTYVAGAFPSETWGEADRGQNFCIDRYEYPGQSGRLPKSLVSAVEAASLCAERGARLCSLGEWQLACAGSDNQLYPYGAEYRHGICRTESSGPVPVGSMRGCVTPFGAFDMSGNVAEWTSDVIPAGQMVAGGDWVGGAAQTRCTSASPFNSSLMSARVGFRCCRVVVEREDAETPQQ